MSAVRTIDLERLPAIHDALTRWVAELVGRFELERVYLYGSFARGRVHEGSDIDLILIGPFAGKLPARIRAVLETAELPVSPLCYTAAEWARMVEVGNPLALEVLRHGQELGGKASPSPPARPRPLAVGGPG